MPAGHCPPIRLPKTLASYKVTLNPQRMTKSIIPNSTFDNHAKTFTMVKKVSSDWNSVPLLEDIVVSIFEVGTENKTFNPQFREAVETAIQSRGRATTWEAIR